MPQRDQLCPWQLSAWDWQVSACPPWEHGPVDAGVPYRQDTEKCGP